MSLQRYDRRRIQRAFKIRGLSIQTHAASAIENVLSRESPSRQGSVLEMILDEVKSRSSRTHRSNSMVVTKKMVSEVVAELTQSDEDVTSQAVQLLGSFEMKRLHYDVMRKSFVLLEDEKKSLHAEAVCKVDMLAQRYVLVQQRILRQDLFRPKLMSLTGHIVGGGERPQTLTPVESLLGKSGHRNSLGIIIQVEEGQYYLEDLTGKVPLDLSNAQVLSNGFFSENSVVLAEGIMSDGIFSVQRIGGPPPELKCDSVSAIGLQNTNLFGTMSSVSERDKLRQQELTNGLESMFVILSDVHLDRPGVLRSLERLFEGFEDVDPLPIFVLMGNFTSKPLTQTTGGVKQITGYFEELADIISNFDNIAKNARFILIPGPHDPGSQGGVLPQLPLPNFFTAGLRSKIDHISFASNPCRIRFFTKELVFMRNNICHKMRKHCILQPCPILNQSPEDQLLEHAVQTMLDQGHLCPLPLSSTPIYWQYDHSLRLYPLPDAIILGDRIKPFYRGEFSECDVLNPGSFCNDAEFVVYRPTVEGDDGLFSSDVEFSQIN